MSPLWCVLFCVPRVLTHWTVWSSEAEPQLARFMGRPGELSPKARFWLFAGWLLPTRFKYVPYSALSAYSRS